MKTKLSPYTIASNCTDLTDIRDGINEIQDEIKRLVSEGENVPSFFYAYSGEYPFSISGDIRSLPS